METGFTQKLLEVTKSVESPTSFLKWISYATIATVLRDNIWIDFSSRRTRVYPNLFVLIIGDSGNTRKSTPLKIMNYLVKSVGNTKIIEGRASIQGVLKELSSTITNSKGKQLKNASGLLYSEEFAAFLVQDPSATKILTDIYDYHKERDVILKSEDKITLKEVVVNMVAASNEAFLSDMFSKIDLLGGLVGRTVLVMEDKARHKNLGLKNDSTEEDWNTLTKHLERISKYRGAASFTDEAVDYMEEWYKNLSFEFDSKTGFESRCHTLVQKLSMIIAASKLDSDFNGIITLDDIELAIQEVGVLIPNYHKIGNSLNTTPNIIAATCTEIMKIMLLNRDQEVDHPALLRALWGKTDINTLDNAIKYLQSAELINIGGMSKATYKLTRKAEEKFMQKIFRKEQPPEAIQ